MGVHSLSQYSAKPACPAAFACARTKHLVQVCVRRLEDVEAVEALGVEVNAAVRSTGPGTVIFADYERAAPLSAQVASVLSRDMRRTNSAIVRSGLLLDPENAVFNLQVERIVRCAGNDSRRLFTDPEELYAWLAESLTDDEKSALREMLPLP